MLDVSETCHQMAPQYESYMYPGFGSTDLLEAIAEKNNLKKHVFFYPASVFKEVSEMIRLYTIP